MQKRQFTVRDFANTNTSLERQVRWLQNELESQKTPLYVSDSAPDTYSVAPLTMLGEVLELMSTSSSLSEPPIKKKDPLESPIGDADSPFEGIMGLAMSASSGFSVYGLESERLGSLHRHNIIGAVLEVTLDTTQDSWESLLRLTPENTQVVEYGKDLCFTSKLKQLRQLEMDLSKEEEEEDDDDNDEVDDDCDNSFIVIDDSYSVSHAKQLTYKKKPRREKKKRATTVHSKTEMIKLRIDSLQARRDEAQEAVQRAEQGLDHPNTIRNWSKRYRNRLNRKARLAEQGNSAPKTNNQRVSKQVKKEKQVKLELDANKKATKLKLETRLNLEKDNRQNVKQEVKPEIKLEVKEEEIIWIQ
ncbi:hypothetical protein CJU90_5123 [Yarrowia sp. C11]|nr:hypothetical protein CJU90_5123 [Yarrowia sp. C11]KAG5364923.1 hypothetical protein CKK34_3751 [Yarrowia sp. E02]